MNDEKSKGEPSAPTTADGELARLLPDLPHRIAYARQAARDDEPLDAAIRDLADACELLLAERERVAGKASVYMAERDAAVDWANRERARIAELTATPPPGTVAALLARVEAEAVASAASAAKIEAGEGEDAADYQSGHAHGLRAAASLIRATLTPSPIDGAVADVLAYEDGVADTFDAWSDLGDIINTEAESVVEERVQFARIARVALAGMLACDAAKGGDT